MAPVFKAKTSPARVHPHPRLLRFPKPQKKLQSLHHTLSTLLELSDLPLNPPPRIHFRLLVLIPSPKQPLPLPRHLSQTPRNPRRIGERHVRFPTQHGGSSAALSPPVAIVKKQDLVSGSELRQLGQLTWDQVALVNSVLLQSAGCFH
jgi:hypothetical protein